MRTRPTSVDDAAIAGAVAAAWLPGVTATTYLPWGFGAHHWRATDGHRTLFVTLDDLAPRHTEESLEAAYAGAAALAAAGLGFVCAPLPAPSGRFTVAAAGGMLSATPWLDGRSPSAAAAAEPDHVRAVAAALDALHRAAPPAGLPEWAPRVAPGFAAGLRARTSAPWASGPLADPARRALAAAGPAIDDWTRRYHELAGRARARRGAWVPTHGEPHHANQVVTASGLRLVDWESLALAPRERDFADLPGAVGDPEMTELFALDWRLSELAAYARWFAAPHTGSDDDHVAFDGLREELAAGA